MVNHIYNYKNTGNVLGFAPPSHTHHIYDTNNIIYYLTGTALVYLRKSIDDGANWSTLWSSAAGTVYIGYMCPDFTNKLLYLCYYRDFGIGPSYEVVFNYITLATGISTTVYTQAVNVNDRAHDHFLIGTTSI